MSSDHDWRHVGGEEAMGFMRRGAKAAEKAREELTAPGDPTSVAERPLESAPSIADPPPAAEAPAFDMPLAADPVPAAALVEFPRPLVYGNPSLGSDPASLPDPNVAVPDTILNG